MRTRSHIREVGLRHGIQMAKEVLPTERKLEWVRAAASAGITDIEVTSFVPPEVVPQFVDAVELRRTVESWLPGERFSGTIARAGLPKTFRQPAREPVEEIA